jgi:hypothetical protein
VAGAVLPEDACGEPGDVGVYRDLDDGVGGAVVCPARAAAEHPGEGPGPGAGGELVQPLPLARDPGAAAQGLVDGVGGVADGGLDVLPGVVVQLSVVAALRLEDLGEPADVELGGVGAGGRARPEPVAAADGLVRRQAAGDGPGDAQAGGAAAAGRRSSWRNPPGSRRWSPWSSQQSRAIRASGWPAAAARRSCWCCLRRPGSRMTAAGSSRASVSSSNSRWLASASRLM